MKLIFFIANVVFWSFLAQQFLPWWIIAIVCFVVAYIFHLSKFSSFVACLLSIFGLWILKVWVSDTNFDVPMSQLLGSLLGNVSSSAVYFLTGMIGGLVAGLSGLLGSWTRILAKD
jgi:hypothetical protein